MAWRRSNGATVMDAVIKKPDTTPLPADIRAEPQPAEPRPSREAAEAAVRVLLAYAGDVPAREGLLDTPKRVVSTFDELYGGYRSSPVEVLDRTFSEIGTYDDLVLVRDIPFYSHCEHHMMPFVGRAHVAYLPVERVVGLSKIARLIDVYARRLQTQEHLNSQIITAIDDGLITCIVTDAWSADVLMLAHMNADALAKTLVTGEAWFYSRSREKLWKKG